MANFLIQYSKNRVGLKEDENYKLLNHYSYKEYSYYNQNIRIDFLNYAHDREKRFLETEDFVVFYQGVILFKNSKKDTLETIVELERKDKIIYDEIKSGSFFLCIYHKQTNSLKVLNDRFGFVPSFYFSNKDSLVISSELKTIEKSLLVGDLTNDFSAISNKFNFDYFLADKTFYNEIKKLEPATEIIFTNLLQKKKYWTWSLDFDTNFEEIGAENLIELFNQGIDEIENKYKGRFLSDLSSGFDTKFLYLNRKNIDTVMTYGDEDNLEYRIVQETLKIKPAELINVKTKLNLDVIKKFVNLTDNLVSGFSVHSVHYLEFFDSYKENFNYVYDGVLGEVLAGKFLPEKNDFLSEFGFVKEYDSSSININDGCLNMFNNDFKAELQLNNDYSEIKNNYLIYNSNNEIDWGKSAINLKFYLDGVNRTILQGTAIRSKYTTRVPYLFYYPFFDAYTKIAIKDIRMKKAYTALYKKLPREYQNVRDDFFVIPFKYSYKTRLIAAGLNQVLQRIGIYKPKLYFDYANDLITDTAFKKDIFSIISDLGCDIVNKKYIAGIFSSDDSIVSNYSYIIRLMSYLLWRAK